MKRISVPATPDNILDNPTIAAALLIGERPMVGRKDVFASFDFLTGKVQRYQDILETEGYEFILTQIPCYLMLYVSSVGDKYMIASLIRKTKEEALKTVESINTRRSKTSQTPLNILFEADLEEHPSTDKLESLIINVKQQINKNLKKEKSLITLV